MQRIPEEGLENQINRYKQSAKIIRTGVRKMGLKMLVDEKIASNTITSVMLPQDINMDAFITRLDEKGFTVYPGKRHLKKRNMFQIANMGAINGGYMPQVCKNYGRDTQRIHCCKNPNPPHSYCSASER